MKIYVTNIFVDNQDKAEKFYTDVLGFTVKNNVPLGENRWLTVVSPEEPEGTELLLEPSDHPAVKPYKDALVADGIPAHSFQVQDLDAERKRLGDWAGRSRKGLTLPGYAHPLTSHQQQAHHVFAFGNFSPVPL